jgi:predicted nucleic acid-binding protein
MSDLAIDSSVVAKWILPESDSAKAQEIITRAAGSSQRLVVLDLTFPEVANAIWKRHRQQQITLLEATAFLAKLTRIPVVVEPAMGLLASAFEIATTYDRAVYDALFVALAQRTGTGITADEPLFNSTHRKFPQVSLLRNM